MQVIFTEQAFRGLEEAMAFIADKVSEQKLTEISSRILNRTDELKTHPYQGQQEQYLSHLSSDYRRLIEGHYKIIYRIEKNTVYIIDIFDSRQDPDTMKY